MRSLFNDASFVEYANQIRIAEHGDCRSRYESSFSVVAFGPPVPCLKLISALFEQQEKALSRQYFTVGGVDRVGGPLANFLIRERIPLRAR